MHVLFLDRGAVRDEFDLILDLRNDRFMGSLDDAIDGLRDNGHLRWFYRRMAVTLPHDVGDEEVPDNDEMGELRQSMEIAVWALPMPPHLVARERRNRLRVNLGRERRAYHPYKR